MEHQCQIYTSLASVDLSERSPPSAGAQIPFPVTAVPHRDGTIERLTFNPCQHPTGAVPLYWKHDPRNLVR